MRLTESDKLCELLDGEPYHLWSAVHGIGFRSEHALSEARLDPDNEEAEVVGRRDQLVVLTWGPPEQISCSDLENSFSDTECAGTARH
jgi:hypothetical protein